MSDYTLSDYRAAVGNGDGMFGGNNGIWFLALLFLFGGGFGNFGGCGNARGTCATTEDLASGFNFNALQGKTNDILAAVNNNNQVLGNAVCQLGYQNGQNFAAIERQLAECCCNIGRSIDSVNYNIASQAASINANTTAQTQKILDAICGNRMADMQNQINQLQLQSALCGIPRVSNFAYGVYPFAPAYGGYAQGYGPCCCNQ